MDNCPSSPVYAVIFTENVVKSPREVFHSLKEASKFANSPEGKAHGNILFYLTYASGARFKKFTTTEEANSFLSSGDCRLSPLSASSPRFFVTTYIPNDLEMLQMSPQSHHPL